MATNKIIERLRARGLLPIVEEVCKLRGVLLEAVCAPERGKMSVSRARHEVWWRLRHHPDREYSFPEIAEFFERAETPRSAAGFSRTSDASRRRPEVRRKRRSDPPAA